MSASIAVLCFPGSNCEHDVVRALRATGADARIIWHGDTGFGDDVAYDGEGFGRADAVVLPGGFAHGDYLRPGAIARFSPIMDAVGAFARDGGPVVGICNGFQVLTEAGLLPGALRRNSGLRFVCATTVCTVSSQSSVLTAGIAVGTRLSLPINHGAGSYTCDAATLQAIEASGQVVLRYDENPNGSLHSIAGIANAAGNVVGLMPHPERASSELLGSADGLLLFRNLLVAATERRTARRTDEEQCAVEKPAVDAPPTHDVVTG